MLFLGKSNYLKDNKELMKEYNYEKNKNVNLEKITNGSHFKLWWKCNKSHEWEAVVQNRTIGQKCPYCSNRKLLVGYNDLATINPRVAKEWNYEKNGKLTPDKITKSSGKKVWWLCHNGHEWEARVTDRIRNHGCPYCVNQKLLSGYNDLATTNPELLKEWDYKKNKEINPQSLNKYSSEKVWWKCSKGHEWEASIRNKVRTKGCPYCTNQKILLGYNDIATTNPELLKEWNYEKNEKTSPQLVGNGSNKKVWWKCDKGHEWETTVRNRVIGQKCPYCTNKRVLPGYNDLSTTNPKLAKEWNYEKNEDLTPQKLVEKSNKKVWWKCGHGHEWKATVYERNRGTSCPICYQESRKRRK